MYQLHPLKDLQWEGETSLPMSFRVRRHTSRGGIALS